MNELCLFAGGGGGILGGVLSGFKTVGAVEWDPYCQAVLLARQADGLLERFPIWGDIQTFDGRPWRGKVGILTAGFPCQPFSQAGQQKGEADERNMWPDTIRILREVGCDALLENVPGLVTSGYFGTILRDLAEAGFDAEWDVFSAAECGARHLRERLWILAKPKRDGLGGILREGGQGEDKRELGSDLDGEGAGVGGPGALGVVSNAQGLGGSVRDFGPREVSEPGEDGVGQPLADASSPRRQNGKCESGGKVRNETRRKESKRRSSIVPNSARLSKGHGHDELGEGVGPSEKEAKGEMANAKDQRDGRRDGSDEQDGGSEGGRGHNGGGEEANDRRERGTTQSSLGRNLDGLASRLDGFKTSWADGTWDKGIEKVAYGIPFRVERLKAIGNGQVPLTAAKAYSELSRRFYDRA